MEGQKPGQLQPREGILPELLTIFRNLFVTL